jgi:hypothetical protein
MFTEPHSNNAASNNKVIILLHVNPNQARTEYNRLYINLTLWILMMHLCGSVFKFLTRPLITSGSSLWNHDRSVLRTRHLLQN